MIATQICGDKAANMHSIAPTFYAPLCSAVRHIRDLTPTAKVLFAMITALSASGDCYAGNKYFADKLGVSVRTVRRLIEILARLNLITVSFDVAEKRHIVPLHSQCADDGCTAILPLALIADNRIPSAAKVLYGELYALTELDGYTSRQSRYFSELYGVTEQAVYMWLKSLEDHGYIKIRLLYGENSKEVIGRHIFLVNRSKYLSQPQKVENVQELATPPIPDKVQKQIVAMSARKERHQEMNLLRQLKKEHKEKLAAVKKDIAEKKRQRRKRLFF